MEEDQIRVDVQQYSRLPRLSSGTVVTLYRAMASALPAELTSPVRTAAQETGRQVRALQSVADTARRERATQTPGPDLRVIDNQADSIAATVHTRLEQFDILRVVAPPAAAEAQALRQRLFPDRTTFLRGGMHAQWEATEAFFRDLDAHGDEPRLRALVGDAFVDALRSVHGAYGKALGVTDPRSPEPASGVLQGPFTAAVDALGDLLLQLVAAINDRSAPAAQRQALRAALAPVDRLREAQARSGPAPLTDIVTDEPDNDPIPDLG